MRAFLLVLMFADVTSNLLDYSYYSEINDSIAKQTKLTTLVTGYMDRGLGAEIVFGFQAIGASMLPSLESIQQAVLDFDSSMMSFDSLLVAFTGDCQPFSGYDAKYISAPSS